MKITAYLIALVKPSIVMAQTNTIAVTSQTGWKACTEIEQVLIVFLTIFATIVGLVSGWKFFPMTMPPIEYLKKSELEIWGSRLMMSLLGGGASAYFVFRFLIEHFGT